MTIDLLAPFRRRILSSNEPDTTELPRYQDGDTTVTLPVITSEETSVRLPDRSGITVVVGSELYKDGTATSRAPSGTTDTARLPATRMPFSWRRLIHPVTSSRLIKGLLASNILVLCLALGLFAGGLWAANEAGVIPDSVKPDILKSDPKPTKTPQPKEHASPVAPAPSGWEPATKPTAIPSSKKHPSSEASASPSASASTSPSASASAPAPTETSPSATTPTSPETTAPAVTPSASAPSPTESSTKGEPTSPASDTATPPTGETGSASPEDTAETPVTP